MLAMEFSMDLIYSYPCHKKYPFRKKEYRQSNAPTGHGRKAHKDWILCVILFCSLYLKHCVRWGWSTWMPKVAWAASTFGPQQTGKGAGSIVADRTRSRKQSSILNREHRARSMKQSCRFGRKRGLEWHSNHFTNRAGHRANL